MPKKTEEGDKERMNQIALDGEKREVEPACKRCYWNNIHGSHCFCMIEHDSNNPGQCKGFYGIDESHFKWLTMMGYGDCLTERFGVWEWSEVDR